MRDRRVARVIDREIAPIWHDRFARLIVRNLPGSSDVIALDVHCGVGRTTAELLARLGPTARVLAIEPDDTLIEFARTRMRPEWKNRVYLKPGNFDDVTAMADDSYNLVVANLVLGDAGDIGSALAEMIRVNRIGGRILATLPMAGSWHEVEDIFAEVLRDAGLTAAVRRLERLRELRPTGSQLAQVVRNLGVAEDDFVIEQERFQMLFPSGREFLFAPVVEHGPLRLWKAVIGKDGSPQELFWRLKEAIDTYYTGHVLAVNVIAGLMNIHVAKGTESPGPRLAARFWRHYPGLDSLWGGLAAGYVRISEPSLPPFGDSDFDFDLEIDEGESRRTGTNKAVTTSVNIITDDMFDPEPSGPISMSSLIAASESPPQPAFKPAPGARTGAEPVRPFSAITPQTAQPSRLKRPPVAEDDFSDINDEPSGRFQPQGPVFAQPPDEDEDTDEPADPTSTFHPDELRAAREGNTGASPSVPSFTDDDDERRDDDDAEGEVDEVDELDADAIVDDDEYETEERAAARAEAAEVEAAEQAEAERAQTERAEAEIAAARAAERAEAEAAARAEIAELHAARAAARAEAERVASERAAAERAEAERAERAAAERAAELEELERERLASERAAAERAADLEELERERLASERAAAERTRVAEQAANAAADEAATDFEDPSHRAPVTAPPPATEIRGSGLRTGLHDSGLRRPGDAANKPAFRAPSDSGSFRAPAGDPNANRPVGARPPEPSGPRPRPRAESSGFTRPPTSESSGFTRPPTSESSGFTRPPRPASGPITGSFNVFAPPKPSASASNMPRVEPDPEPPRTAPPPEPSGTTSKSEAEDAIAQLNASLTDQTTWTPARIAATDDEDDAVEADELDEAEELEELEDEDDPPPVTTRGAPPPPPPKAPPPPPSNAFKPRPLLPIVPPKKK